MRFTLNRSLRADSCCSVDVVKGGAGDFFAAGFLAGLAHGWDLEKCGTVGSLLAGEVIKVVGAELELAHWEEINKKVQTL